MPSIPPPRFPVGPAGMLGEHPEEGDRLPVDHLFGHHRPRRWRDRLLDVERTLLSRKLTRAGMHWAPTNEGRMNRASGGEWGESHHKAAPPGPPRNEMLHHLHHFSPSRSRNGTTWDDCRQSRQKAVILSRYWTVLLLFMVLSCGDPVSPETEFLGTYQLQTINGHSLPYVVAQSGQNTITITADQLVVADGGSWSEVTSYRIVENGAMRNETQPAGGTWVRTGTQLALYLSGASTTNYIGTIGDKTLTFNDGTFVQVFRK